MLQHVNKFSIVLCLLADSFWGIIFALRQMKNGLDVPWLIAKSLEMRF